MWIGVGIVFSCFCILFWFYNHFVLYCFVFGLGFVSVSIRFLFLLVCCVFYWLVIFFTDFLRVQIVLVLLFWFSKTSLQFENRNKQSKVI